MFKINQKVKINASCPFGGINKSLINYDAQIVTIKSKIIGEIGCHYTVEEINDIEISDWHLFDLENTLQKNEISVEKEVNENIEFNHEPIKDIDGNNLKLDFVAYGYQHCINSNDDWDGYEITRIYRAVTPEDANNRIINSFSMHTELDEVTEFICPINGKKYSIKMLNKIYPIIGKWMKKKIKKQIIENAKKQAIQKNLNSLENAKETSRKTFLDREMPYLVA